jgi:hypothetical protein
MKWHRLTSVVLLICSAPTSAQELPTQKLLPLALAQEAAFIALLGCALINPEFSNICRVKHLRSSAVDHLVITRDVLGNPTVGSPQQRQLSGPSGFR